MSGDCDRGGASIALPAASSGLPGLHRAGTGQLWPRGNIFFKPLCVRPLREGPFISPSDFEKRGRRPVRLPPGGMAGVGRGLGSEGRPEF